MSPLESARAVRAAMPAGGLFHEKEWRIAPAPFELPGGLARELEKLGYRLMLFLRACDQLYRQSVKGRQPEWVADILDAGKPPELVAFQRECGLAGDIPRVIRPDLVLTEDGFTIAEIDSVPGGIGLTAWLNKTYAGLGFDVLGGADGMVRGFSEILPGGDIVVSEEAATYRPEMEWLAGELNQGAQLWRVVDGSARDDWAPRIYRFFELFDLANVPASSGIMDGVRARALQVTPPFKPALEEKLWFALFWMKPLEDFWHRELHMVDRSGTPAAPCRSSEARGALVGRGREIQPEASEFYFEGERIFRTGVGVARCGRGKRPAAEGMADRVGIRLGGFSLAASHPPGFSYREALRCRILAS